VFSQQSEADRNAVHLVFEDAVTASDLAGHRRAAIVAARKHGRPFAVVTDLSDCESVSTPAAAEVRETLAHLVPFGLDREVVLAPDGTPDHVLDTFDATAPTPDHEVVTVTSMAAVERELAAAEQARG
jgi:hypothetical protein